MVAGELEELEQEPRRRGQAIIFFIATVAAALCIDFGTFHRLHNSDSIVPVLVSLYRWTPFYWEQDRLGMLVPLLTIPFKSPLANLLAQSAINAFCGLGAFFLCARYAARRAWLSTGAISAFLFLLLNARGTCFQYLGLSQPYGVGIFLGVGGLLLLENLKFSRAARITSSFICLLAASWVDGAVLFVLLPLIFFRSYFDGDAVDGNGPMDSLEDVSGENQSASPGGWRNLCRRWMLRAKQLPGLATLLVLLTFLIYFIYSGIVSHSSAYGEWPYPPLRPWRWPGAWFQFGKIVWADYLFHPWGIAVATLLVLGVLFRFVPLGGAGRINSPALTLLASAVTSFLLMGSLVHIQDMEFDPRFAMQSMVLLQVGAVAWVLLPGYALLKLRGRFALTAASILVFLGAPIYLYGRPSLARVRADLDETMGQYTPEILQSGATHMVGDYWTVWPATFHANLALYEVGSDRRIWGVTTRSGPTRIFWSQIPLEKMRLAAVVGDPGVNSMLELYSFPPVAQEQTYGDIVILRPVPNSK